MTMRFGSLLLFVLLGIALIDGTPVEKREVGKEEDKNVCIEIDSSFTCECTQEGDCTQCSNHDRCHQVSSCNGDHKAKRDNPEKILLFFEINATATAMSHFNSIHGDSYNCKCTGDGYCERRTDKNGDWHTVKDCSGENEYLYCYPAGCRAVSDGKCYFDGDHKWCEKCSANGCKMTQSCEVPSDIIFEKPEPLCKYCDKTGCKRVACLPQCSDDKQDIMIERCYGRNDMICGDVFCKIVYGCNKFVTCKCDMDTNTYTRCYGYKQGTHQCTVLNSCSDVAEEIESAGRRKLAHHVRTCECPSNFSYCLQRDISGVYTYVDKCDYEYEATTEATTEGSEDIDSEDEDYE